MDRPLVSFLSDFGAADVSAAICRGVILGIAPDARILDITHEVRKFGVRDGAFHLANALPYLPIGIHVAVVDPGVGTARRAIALLAGRGDLLIGPDNGLLVPAAEALGGIVAARELQDRTIWLGSTTATFHGRDIFAPVAGHLATGLPFDAVGPIIDTRSLVRLTWPEATVAPGRLSSAVVYVDTFGNLKLGAMTRDLVASLGTLAGGDRLAISLDPGGAGPVTPRTLTLPWSRTFGDVAPGEAALYDDSFGRVTIAVNQGSAAAQLGVALDDPVTISRAGPAD